MVMNASWLNYTLVMAKRRIFDELMEGIAEMKKHREGKIILRSFKVDTPTVAPVSFQDDQGKQRGVSLPASRLRPKVDQ
jgi:hypothetical protein